MRRRAPPSIASSEFRNRLSITCWISWASPCTSAGRARSSSKRTAALQAVLDERPRAVDRHGEREPAGRLRPRREVEQPPRGAGDALQPVLDQLQVDALPLRQILPLQQPVDGVLHAADRVVDLVGDAGGERADARQARTQHQRAFLLLGLFDGALHRLLQRPRVVAHLLGHLLERRQQRIEFGHAARAAG
jgi:hypothetical protein